MEATIKDVARQAGVSTATVSRVINNTGGVRSDTVKRVMDAVKYVNYVPNIMARNLKTESSTIIGFVISNISNTHFTKMANKIESILREQGLNLIVCNTADDPNLELDHLQRMIAMHADGIILNTTCKNNDWICELSHKIPMVLVDRNITDPVFLGDFVGSNGYGGVMDLTKHLIEKGHRDIAIITSDLSTSTGRERLNGFSAAMRTIGIVVDDYYIYRYDSQHFSEEDGVAGCQYLMGLEKRPTAIVVINNEMTIGVYKYLHNNDISVPDDISVVSYGNINNSDLFRVEPTFATLNPNFIGEKAANLLLSRIEAPGRGNREIIFEPLLVVNESTKTL
ncbi:LacI family DNA-binding transcriptional regulator [Parablautia muri]|uniref:LacI family transcriptional regulator n=1 Tax=Parablautia muri TaxID=2320879 RepID=A0A9X5BFQ7_9FIRM|nr:LacI family DNA-binding transcriptional regulator [Parablautia muri]NBJ92803.1 LacI family transcriptional regulator [Parablautia muri]